MATPTPRASVEALATKTEAVWTIVDAIVGGRASARHYALVNDQPVSMVDVTTFRSTARDVVSAFESVVALLLDPDQRVVDDTVDEFAKQRERNGRSLYPFPGDPRSPVAGDITSTMVAAKANSEDFWPIWKAWIETGALDTRLVAVEDEGADPADLGSAWVERTEWLSGTDLRDAFYAFDPDAEAKLLAFRDTLAPATGRRL